MPVAAAAKEAKNKTPKKEPRQKRQLPEWEGSPAVRYLILIAITVLVGLSLIMAFSASSNDAVIRQVQREFAEQSQAAQTLEESMESEREYYAALEQVQQQAQEQAYLGSAEAADADSPLGILGFISMLFASAYGAGFRHLLFAMLGAVIAFLLSRKDYRKFAIYAIPASFILLVMLVVLWLFGTQIGGSARWINVFDLFTFQPSEFAKPVLILLFAYYCSWAKDADESGLQRQKAQAALPFYQRDWVMPAILVGGCLFAILVSPDVGTTLIIVVGLFAAYVLAGWPWMRVVAGLGVLGTLFMVRILLSGEGYQQRRIFDFITYWTEGIASHQTWQAELALGSGGIFGLGPGLSRQKFRYLPEAHNDFIIAILGEELGLMGVSLVLIAFTVILFGGLYIASRSTDRFGLALAGSATILIVFQALLNIFAVVNLGPVTGKPLPFVTLGGSSMVSTFILIGFIFSVARFGQRSDAQGSVSFASVFAGSAGSSGGSRASRASETSPAQQNKSASERKARQEKRRRLIKGRTERAEERDDSEDDIDWQW